jgi:hypothetical protein
MHFENVLLFQFSIYLHSIQFGIIFIWLHGFSVSSQDLYRNFISDTAEITETITMPVGI